MARDSNPRRPSSWLGALPTELAIPHEHEASAGFESVSERAASRISPPRAPHGSGTPLPSSRRSAPGSPGPLRWIGRKTKKPSEDRSPEGSSRRNAVRTNPREQPPRQDPARKRSARGDPSDRGSSSDRLARDACLNFVRCAARVLLQFENGGGVWSSRKRLSRASRETARVGDTLRASRSDIPATPPNPAMCPLPEAQATNLFRAPERRPPRF